MGAAQSVTETNRRLDLLRQAVDDAPGADAALRARVRELSRRLDALQVRLSGDRTVSSRSEPTDPAITNRVQSIVSGHWNSTSNPTETHRRAYTIARADFARFMTEYRTLVETDLRAVEAAADAAGVPWTPGRMPR